MIVRKSMKAVLFESLYDLMKSASFKSITVQQIVKNCGTTKTTFYNYFRDKYELLSWGILRKHQGFFSTYNDALDWNASALMVLKSFQSDVGFFVNAFAYDGQNCQPGAMRKDIYLTHYDWIESVYNPEEANIDELKFAIDFYSVGVSTLIYEWVKKGAKGRPEELVRKFEQCMPPILREYYYISPAQNKG